MLYDWKELKKKIIAVTSDVFSQDPTVKVEEALEVFRKIVSFPISQPELRLDALPDLLISLENVLSSEQFSREKLYAFTVPFEAYLKKTLFLIDTAYYNTHRHNLTLGDNPTRQGLISKLGLNPNNIRYHWTHLAPNYSSNFAHQLLFVYNTRNDLAHFCNTCNRPQYWTAVQSYLVMYLYAAFKHRQAILQAVEPYFLTKYLQNYIQYYNNWQTDYVSLPGIEFEKIDLWASEVPDVERQNNAQDKPEHIKNRPRPHKEQPNRAMRSGSIAELRKTLTEKQMVLMAEPGMGKSTALQYLAYTDAIAIENGNTNTPYPVYIELKEFQAADNIRERIIRKLGIDAGVVEILLTEGKVTLLLDGLNEVAENLKNEAINTIKRLMMDYPKVFVLITTRPNAYERYYFDGLHSRGDAPVFRIQEMNEDQIVEFLDKNAHNNAATTIIKAAIEQNEALKNIIRTPLLLKMLIALVSQNPKNPIPTTETGIILGFMEGICQREQDRDADFKPLRFLKRLAFLAHQIRMRYKANVALYENDILSLMHNIAPQYELENMLEKAVELRLLTHHLPENQYSFAHELYQEALWAKQQTLFDAAPPAPESGTQYRPAIDLWFKSGFKEAIRLYSGLLTKNARFEFVHKISQRDVLLAARCKNVCWYPEPELQQMIVDRAKLFAAFFEDAWEWCAKGLIALLELEAREALSSVILDFEIYLDENHDHNYFALNKWLGVYSNIEIMLDIIIYIGESGHKILFQNLCKNLEIDIKDMYIYSEKLLCISGLLYARNMYDDLILFEKKIKIPLVLQNKEYLKELFSESTVRKFSTFNKKRFVVVFPNAFYYTIDVIRKYEFVNVLKEKWYIESYIKNNRSDDLSCLNVENLLREYHYFSLDTSHLLNIWYDWIKANPVQINWEDDSTVRYLHIEGLNKTQALELINILETTGLKWELNYAVFLRKNYGIYDENNFKSMTEFVLFVLSNELVTDNYLSAVLADEFNIVDQFPLEQYAQSELENEYYEKAIDIIDRFGLYSKFDIISLCVAMYNYCDEFGKKLYVHKTKEIIEKFGFQKDERLKEVLEDMELNYSQALENSYENMEISINTEIIEDIIRKYINKNEYNIAKRLILKFCIENSDLIKSVVMCFSTYRYERNYRIVSDIPFAFKYAKLNGIEDADIIQQLYQKALGDDNVDKMYYILKTNDAPISSIEILLQKVLDSSRMQLSAKIIKEYFQGSKYELILFNKSLTKDLSIAKDCITAFNLGDEYKEILFEKAIVNDIAIAYESIIDLDLKNDKIAIILESALNSNLKLAKIIISKYKFNDFINVLFQKSIEVDALLAFDLIEEFSIAPKFIAEVISELVLCVSPDLIIERIKNYNSQKINRFYFDFNRPRVYHLDEFLRNYVLGLEKIWTLKGLQEFISIEKLGELTIHLHFQTTKIIMDRVGLWNKIYKQECLEKLVFNFEYRSNTITDDWFYICNCLMNEDRNNRFLIISNVLNIYDVDSEFIRIINTNWFVCIFKIDFSQEIRPTVLQAIQKGYTKTVKKWSDNINLHAFCPPEEMVAAALQINDPETAEYWVRKYNLYEQFPQFTPPATTVTENDTPPTPA